MSHILHPSVRRQTRSIRVMLEIRILALVGLVTIGGIGFILIEGLSPLEAIYQTIVTVSTVGFGEPKDGLSEEGKIFTAFLILSGIGLFSWALTSLGAVLASGEVQRSLTVRKMVKEIKTLNDHFIICGYGRLGRAISQRFVERNIPHLIVEEDADIAVRIDEKGIPVIVGDGTEDDVLMMAGLERARGLITTTPEDATNVYITLTARQVGPELTILARAIEDGSERKLLRAGATRVFRPHEIGGSYMAQAAVSPSVLDFFEIASGMAGDIGIQLEEIRVPPSALKAEGETLMQLNLSSKFEVIVVGIQRPGEQLQFNPGAQSQVMPNDLLLVLGTPEHLKDLQDYFEELAAAENPANIIDPVMGAEPDGTDDRGMSDSVDNDAPFSKQPTMTVTPTGKEDKE